jgi:hypothetical protein
MEKFGGGQLQSSAGAKSPVDRSSVGVILAVSERPEIDRFGRERAPADCIVEGKLHLGQLVGHACCYSVVRECVTLKARVDGQER